MKDPKTPDITPAQMKALAVAVVGFLAALGLPLSSANENRLMTVAVVFPSVLMLADAIIRFGRALMYGKKMTDEDLDLR